MYALALAPALALALVLALVLAPGVRAAELVMYEQAGCVWCAKFNAEIAPAYAKTEAGERAPLRRVDIHEPIPADLADIPVERFTPTFVLVEDGTEIDRIRGYPGDEFFWHLLDTMLARLPESP
ncbi:transcriptional regulator [Pseudohoeflea sp. DP4N28-3]|uniref:Transcriptional regulator n=1 Tax=Pseudohoeflea coraliihabitans TaxID=2860393 RepID=A0ABS6WR44_9HYPH|nr:transcriptional regulator [Pseudohoeflea sp. DP4N28-3]